jgi:hypothetical protein
MNITPHLGIGDLLIIKMIQISHKLDIRNININHGLIVYNCENYDQKIYTITKFVELLFPNTTYHINNNNPNFYNIINNYKIKQTYIYDDINIGQFINIQNEYSDYIIFHTKMRHDSLIDKFNNEMLVQLNDFLSRFVSTKKILILGERNIGQNHETITHKTQSLYNNLLVLKNNNHVIDLTHDELTCGNPDFDKCLSDIQLINKSLCNITFGIGGPLSICKAFSRNNISFIPFYELTPSKDIIDSMNTIDNTIVSNVHELENRVNDKIGAIGQPQTETVNRTDNK